MKSLQGATYSVMLSPIAAATTARTANLDCKGADYATIVCNIGVELNTNATGVSVSLLESDDTTATNFATFNAASQQTIDNTAATNYVLHVDLKGRKRYLRIALTPDTTTNGAVLSSVVGILDGENKLANSANANNVAVV